MNATKATTKKATTAKKPVVKPTAKKESANAMNKPKENPFLNKGGGDDALFAGGDNPNEFECMANLDDIEIRVQVREEFEDEENSLADLGRSLRKHQIQSLLLALNPPGSDKPYLLVAGERRVRGARIEGLTALRARVKEMSDAEIEDAQFAENIHRKNLSQIEEAKKIQRDLDQLGSVEAVLAKHQKSHAWLSKILALLHLPEQAKRLVTENVSADVEVINTVKTIEKTDPVKAKALVDDLKKTRGKENARDKAAAVKNEVKPSKKAPKAAKSDGGTVATPKDRSQEEPGQASIFSGAKTDAVSTGADPFGSDEGNGESGILTVEHVLNTAFTNILEHGSNPKTVLDVLSVDDKEKVDNFLHDIYNTGAQVENVGRAVLLGFRNGQFATNGTGAFSLVAFLQGVDSEAKYNLLDVLGSVKA